MVQGLKVVQFVTAASIPFLIGYVTDANSLLKFLIGIIGFVTAVLVFVLGFFNFQEKWIEFRATTESLRQEKYLFLTKSGPYDSSDAFGILFKLSKILFPRKHRAGPRI